MEQPDNASGSVKARLINHASGWLDSKAFMLEWRGAGQLLLARRRSILAL